MEAEQSAEQIDSSSPRISCDETETMERNTIKDRKLPLTIVKAGDVKCSMNDVGGYQEAKLEVIEFVNFVKNRQRYENLGARMPKGALLVGPPGTGKTLLARATAAEANIPFISCTTSSLLLGTDGPDKLRDVFTFAYKKAPCVLFFDEIDCIARSRDHHLSKPETQCLTEMLLVQLDGFEQRADNGLIILGSTNCQEDMDSALLRPGRFDRVIQMLQPDLATRMAIFQVHLKPLTTAANLDKTYLAKRFALLTDCFSGAQIAAVCNESAMIAARQSFDEISMVHLEEALDRVWSGLKKRKAIDGAQKLRLARHDAAHAVAAWFLPGAKPPTKLSIVPDMAGNVSCSQVDNRCCLSTSTRAEVMNIIAWAMAGAAAEEMFYGEYRTDSAEDFRSATDNAWTLVADCGMTGSDLLGKMSLRAYNVSDGIPNLKEKVVEEMKRVLDQCYEIAKQVVHEQRQRVEKVAELLTMKDLLTLDMLVEILGPSPHIDLEKLNFENGDLLPEGLKNWNE